MTKITSILIPLCVVVGAALIGLNFVAFKLFNLNALISALVDTLGIVFLIGGYFLAVWYEMLIHERGD